MNTSIWFSRLFKIKFLFLPKVPVEPVRQVLAIVATSDQWQLAASPVGQLGDGQFSTRSVPYTPHPLP